MITFLVGRLIGLGVAPRLAKPLLAGMALVLLVVALVALRACDKKNIIEDFTAGQEAAVAKEDLKANEKAAEERLTDDRRLTQEGQQIKEAISNAGPNIDDRRAAYHDCVRKQQAARRNNQPPANC
jgi:hypothetical protein